MNITIKIGRLTAEPELRYTNSGKSVVNFNIATRKKFKQEGQKDADFFRCIAWNKAAEFIANNVTKGGRIAIVGRSENNGYQNQQGQQVKYDEIIIDDFEIIDFANSSESQSNNNQSNQQQSSFSSQSQANNTFGNSTQVDISDDDLPF